MARRHAPGWGPAPGWGQPFPGWDPLDDPGTLPLRAVRALLRWWWPISATAGFLVLVGYTLAHDPQPGLSDRSWLTVALAAVVALLLTAHRARRGRLPRWPLARAVAEYAVVALLAALLVTAGAGQPPTGRGEDTGRHRQATEQPAHRHPPAEHADAGAADRRPGIVRVATGVWGWLAELWHTAGELADRRSPPTPTPPPTPNAQALPPPPAPPTWRSQP
jgi:hypothetical protein